MNIIQRDLPKHVVSCALALIAGSVLPAGAQDTNVLLTHKSWTVEHHYVAESGTQLCTAGTWSQTGTSFDVVAYDTGLLGMALFDADWRMPPGQTRSIVADVDYERWTAAADVSPQGSMLMAEIGSADAAIEFLGDLQNSDAVAIYNEDMRRIATFSLAGSAAAIAKLMECWDRIHTPVNDADPFFGVKARSSDPFL